MNRPLRVSSLLLLACVVACGSDEGTGLGTPPAEVRDAPPTVVIAGVQVGVTGIAYREYSAAGAAVGETHWIARVAAPSGMTLPSLTATELWYITGTRGQSVTITTARLVTEEADPYLEVQGTGGVVNPGTEADVVVRLRDSGGNLFLIRATGVSVQRYERLE